MGPATYRRHPPWFDVALAGVLAAYGLYDVLAHRSWPGPRAVDGALVAVMTVALAFRRVVPMAVLLIVGGALVTAGYLYGSAQAWSTVFPFVVAVYSAAAYHRSVPAVVAVVAATITLRDLNDPLVHRWTDRDFTVTLGVLTVLAGVEGRRMMQRSGALDSRAETLERDEALLTSSAAAAERQRIARELHDIISHGLGVMVLQAGAAEQIVATDPARARTVLSSIRSTGQEAVVELDAMLGLMRQEAELSRQPQPTIEDISTLVERARQGGTPVALHVDLQGVSPAPALQLSAFRVVQEALTNAIKHAPGANVRIDVVADERRLDVTIIDDGAHPQSTLGGRRGLAGMAERAAIFGGTFRAGPRPGRGWEVHVTLPIRR